MMLKLILIVLPQQNSSINEISKTTLSFIYFRIPWGLCYKTFIKSLSQYA
jgi:hypothetical protein